ncbi:acyl-protein thioesterase 1 [Paraglaciecola mesophila KMM 241]|uniref:Acyl-protein thioesterase 1 n=1 Tax=Paraglaciecola mesophila KMM 241 TaxID=1128912 RepID=K6ZC19_9ALTE|nr:dienelactone hydrolase family protein [Paraglaciecola mesophila]GAC26523.1 acyl-protein thioesterase 1 [Paraglaciecola mesophila KMM 241]
MSDNNLEYVEVNPSQPHSAVVIWLHGLGDSGNGFAPIVPELKIPDALPIRFVFPHAPVRPITVNNNMEMRAWYDIASLDFNHRADRVGVEESAKQVEVLIDAEIANGTPAERIVLAGFSQGGVIALHLGTRINKKLAGIMALSTYMCEPETLTSEASDANKSTPILMAHGQQDNVVPVFMGNAAYKVLEENGYPVTWQDYPMQHSVCLEEINHISVWLQARFS